MSWLVPDLLHSLSRHSTAGHSKVSPRGLAKSRRKKRKARKWGKVKSWKEWEKVEIKEQCLSFIPCTVWIQLLHELIVPAEIKQTVTVRSDFLLGSSVSSMWLEREILRCLWQAHSHALSSVYFCPQLLFLVPHHWTSNIPSFHLMCNYYDYHSQIDPWGPELWPREHQIQLHKLKKIATKKSQQITSKVTVWKKILLWCYLVVRVIVRSHSLEVQCDFLGGTLFPFGTKE